MKYNFRIKSLDELNSLAKLIANNLEKTDVIALQGGLGSGKTAFSRLLIQEMANSEIVVTSPTFNILNIYNLDDVGVDLYHYDLYRIEDENEIYELALDDALSSGITLIEWSDIIKNQLPEKTIFFEISPIKDGDNNEREISISSSGKDLKFLNDFNN